MMHLPINLEEHLVQVPFVSRLWPAAAQLIGEGLPRFLALLTDRFVGDDNPAGHHRLFDVVISEAEMKIETHTVIDNLSRER